MFGERFVSHEWAISYGKTVLNVSECGYYCPRRSQNNFAVPNKRIIRLFDSYSVQGERKLGVYADTMRNLSSTLENTIACRTVDGKIIKQGLTDDLT